MAADTFQKSLSTSTVLIVTAIAARGNQLRAAMKTIGFNQISSTNSHVEGVARSRYRPFSHVLFDARGTDMEAVEFVKQVFDNDEKTLLIAVSEEPRVDDVFGLLRNGARHFLVIPFTVDTLEGILKDAKEGPPLSDAVLNSPNRNAALTGVILNSLYRQSVLMRQAREFATAKRELEREAMKLMQAVDMALMFCEGNEEDLIHEIMEACITRANTAASRLGRTRKKLATLRSHEDGEEEGEPTPSK